MFFKDLYKSLKDIIRNLIDRVFVENIILTAIIICELLSINKYFILSMTIAIIVIIAKIYRKRFFETILTYNLFKYKHFENFTIFGTLNVTMIILYVFFYSLIPANITLLNVLLFMILRGIITVEMQFAQNVLSIELVESILYGYEFNIPECFENEYLEEITNLMEDFKKRDRKLMEENLKSEQMKMDLITNISHDLKTPLTSIINYSDLLSKKEEIDDEANKFISVLNRNSTRLKELIQDLIFAAKTNTKDIEVERTLFELNELVLQIYADYDSLFDKNELNFVYESENEEVLIYTDVNLFVRIVENLLSNAAKYSKKGTKVMCGVVEMGEYVEFYIKNETREKLEINSNDLIGELVKADKSRHTEGSGLGLNIVMNLSEILGAKLKIESDDKYFIARVKLLRDYVD